MRKVNLILFIATFYLSCYGQEKKESMPFVLLIDNEVPNPSYITGRFLIKDSLDVVKDSINFDYEVGKLNLTKSDFNKFFNVKQDFNIFLKFELKQLQPDTTFIFIKQIHNKYINREYPNGFINKGYFIVKIFNKFNKENRAKYYFKKDENYIVQIKIPGFSTLLPNLKKE